MKTETPITDALRAEIPEPSAVQRMIASHADLEREVAALRDALREASSYLTDRRSIGEQEALENAKKALAGIAASNGEVAELRAVCRRVVEFLDGWDDAMPDFAGENKPPAVDGILEDARRMLI